MQVQKLLDTKKLNKENEAKERKAKPIKEIIEFDTFTKIDIRSATVLECEKVPKADKLLRFLLDDGLGKRTILSGIAEYYPNPEELIGSQILFVANLAPRKMRGMMSEGMILSAENPDGTLTLVRPGDKLANGAEIV